MIGKTKGDRKMTSLGNQIQEARKKANMTQAQLADALGISREEVAAWEKDEQRPEKKMLQKMGDQFDTVLLDPVSVEAQRKSDEKLEKVKAAEFQGKKGGLFSGNSSAEDGGGSKMWLIPLALALVLALAVYLLLQPRIS
jgi:transcriptional regulator with XRE-family HTH domain